MRLIKGENLTTEQRSAVFGRFVHRGMSIGPGKPYKDDLEWLKAHSFYVTNEGRLSNKHKSCEPSFMGK